MEYTDMETEVPQAGLQNPAAGSDRVKASVAGSGLARTGSVTDALGLVDSGEGRTISTPTTAKATERASKETDCEKLKKELLAIRAHLKLMFATCQKQKNISQAVKDGIGIIEKHTDNAFQCQERIELFEHRGRHEQPLQTTEGRISSAKRGTKRKQKETMEVTPAKKTKQMEKAAEDWTTVV